MPRTIGYDVYRLSRDLEIFLLTHSNHTAGPHCPRQLIRTAIVIPFRALYGRPSVFREEPLSLGQILSEVCLEFPPNCDWPTTARPPL
jgi:hypothetical protein